MMKQNILILVVGIFFVSSCKNKESKSEKVVEVNPNTFKIEVEGTWKKDDELIIFWKDASIAYFDGEHTIYQGIKGSDMPQKIIFELEEGFIPNDVRFDVSSKKEQSEITINYIKIEQQNRFFIISKDKLPEFFKINEYIESDLKTGILKTKEIDGSYDPILFTQPAIYPKLEEILATKF